MDKKEKQGKSWVSDLRHTGNRTLFGKTGIQIKGLPRTTNGSSCSHSYAVDSSEESDSTVIYIEKPKKKVASKHGLSRPNSSSASTEYEILKVTNEKKNDKKKSYSFLQSEKRSIPVPSQQEKQNQNVKKKRQVQDDPTESSDSTDEPGKASDRGKRKRQHSGPVDTHSTMCAPKKSKTVYVDSTGDSSDVIPTVKLNKGKRLNAINEDSEDESSDRTLLSLKNTTRHSNKRKSEDIDKSSSSEEERKFSEKCERIKHGSERKKVAVQTPKLTLEFSSSGDEDLPVLSRPQRRYSSDSSTKSQQSNTSSTKKKPVTTEESDTDSDVPLDRIMQKRATDEPKVATESDSEESQSLLPQVKEEKSEKYLSAYTQEEDCIFICDSDDDLYSSMSQQNLNFDFDEKREESENEDDEIQLTRFFLGEEDEKPKPSSEFFNTATQKVECESDDENKYDILTQVKPMCGKKSHSIFDADTQIVICDDFDSDDDRLFDAETQIMYDTIPKEEKDDSDEATQEYYNAPTQVDNTKRMVRRKSFDLGDNSDEETMVPLSPIRKLVPCDSGALDKTTKVDRQNKHSIVQRLSDEGCTIEHTKVQTVKVTKQFNSQADAQKYLEKVHSSENFLDNETQEYDWEEDLIRSRKKDAVKAEKVSPYDAMTQVEPSHTMDTSINYRKSPTRDSSTVKAEPDPYNAQTQAEPSHMVNTSINSRKSEKSRQRNSSTGKVKGEVDLYNAQTQVDIIDISDNEEPETKKSYIIKPKDKTKSNSELYNAETLNEIDMLPQTPRKKVNDSMGGGDRSDIVDKDYYNQATQVVHDDVTTDSDLEMYAAETQVVQVNVITGSDEEMYSAATQAVQDDVMTESDEEMFTAATQVESDLLPTKEDNYNAQTLAVDVDLDSEDFYNNQTQVEIAPNLCERNVFTAMTKKGEKDDEETDGDCYLQKTQVIDDVISDDDLVYGMATQVQDPVLNSEEEETIKSDESIMYVPMLEDDNEMPKTGSPKSEDGDEGGYVVMLDSPSPPRSDRTPKKDITYENHTLLKKVSSAEKRAIQIDPVKPKSTKEKQESFRLEKDKFYSKKPEKQSVKRSLVPQKESSDIKIVEDNGKDWLSKDKTKTRDRKRQLSSKHTETQSTKSNDSIRKAKQAMEQRRFAAAPVKRRHQSVEGGTNVSDVTLPDEKTILAKGLPLLEYPGEKAQVSPQKTEQDKRDSSEVRKRDRSGSSRSGSSSNKRDKHEKSHRHSSSSGHRRSHDKSSEKSHDHSKQSKKSHKSSNCEQKSDKKSHDKKSCDRKSEERAKNKESKDHKSSQSYKDNGGGRDRKSSKTSSSSKSDRDRGDKNSKRSDKENNGHTGSSSSLGRIPKLSDKAVQQTEKMSIKSPLTTRDRRPSGGSTLDSQSVSGMMSLIGMSGTGNVQKPETTSSEPLTVTATNQKSDNLSLTGTETETNQKSDNTALTSVKVNPPPVSMYTERVYDPLNGPKSILSKPGPRGKHSRKVTFKIPSYSQKAENEAKNNARKVYKEENLQSYIKQHFPDGIPDLGTSPNQGISQNQLPGQQRPNLMHKLPLQQQASKAMPGYIAPQSSSTQMNRRPVTATTAGVAPGQRSAPVPPVRVPVPVFKQGNSPQQEMPITDLDYFFTKILKWNAAWLNEYEKHRMTPPDIEAAFPVKQLLNSYDSYEDYFVRLFPHLFMETWEMCLKSWLDSKEREKEKESVNIAFTRVDKPNEKVLVYTFSAVAPRNRSNVLYEGDMVIVNMWGVGKGQQKPKYYLQFGYIERIKYHKHKDVVDKILQTFPGLVIEGKSAEGLIGLEIIVKTRLRQFKMLPSQKSFITPVTSLVTTVRQYIALSNVFRTTMINHVLCSSCDNHSSLRVFHNHPSVKDQDREGLECYNPSQQKAIIVSSKIALEPPSQNRIVLLQGPPGTGKSYTIIGIIKKILQNSNGRCKICLCAPSNSAVDELIIKLIAERRQMYEEKKPLFGLVRIGKPENMHHDVSKYTFLNILKSNLDAELKKKMRAKVGSSEFKELDTLNNRIQSLQAEIEEKTIKLQHIEVGKLQTEINKLKKKKDDMEAEIQQQYKDVRLTRSEEDRVRRNVLLQTNIVCGTLSSFGHFQFMDILAPFDRKTQVRRSYFNCIIVDEASQATELDTLIPLQYGTSKLILVGDPEQLPPTVLSQKCAQKYFGQSLFERFFNHFKHAEYNPVLFLDTQYRMHPDIAYFPSKFVYLNALKTAESVKERCNKFQLKPYILFDMQEGQEVTTRRGAITNSTEAEFTIELCEFLLERGRLQEKEIGIIAPYQQQKKIIKEGLKSSGLHEIEVNTVDGFQGREKEVIILSCTRAKNSGGGIGFLANSKRMNVALTRGKSALYVVGCLDSLRKGDTAWRTLIEDAESRNVIKKVESHIGHEMFNACLTISARLGRQFVS